MFMMAACLKKGHEQVAMVHTHPKPARQKTQPFSLEGQILSRTQPAGHPSWRHAAISARS